MTEISQMEGAAPQIASQFYQLLLAMEVLLILRILASQYVGMVL